MCLIERELARVRTSEEEKKKKKVNKTSATVVKDP